MTSTVALSSADFSSHGVSAALTALTPSTKYHVELVAIYGAAKTTVLGGERTFTTATAASAPAVATGPATALNETEATLEGSVDPEGEATEYFFEYGTNSSYGHATAAKSLPADNLNHAVTMRLTGLTPGTEYHFRLVAKNLVGSADGGRAVGGCSRPARAPGERRESPGLPMVTGAAVMLGPLIRAL